MGGRAVVLRIFEDEMSELTCLELGIVLWLVHVFAQVLIAMSGLGISYLVGARDAPPADPGTLLGRATRALHNYVENFAPFAAADLGLIATQHTGGPGATIWILARIVYIPIYFVGIPYLRTGIWIVSIVGLVMMLAQLAGR